MDIRVITAVVLLLVGVEGHFGGNRGRNGGPRVMCGPDTILISTECWTCACPHPNKLAKCFHRRCEPREKPGICPSTQLKMDEHALCQPERIGCRTDKDCPGSELCCFSYCKGAVCKPALPDPRVQPPRLPGPGGQNQGPPGGPQRGPPGGRHHGPGGQRQGPPGDPQRGPPGGEHHGPGGQQQGPPGGPQQGPPGGPQRGPPGGGRPGPGGPPDGRRMSGPHGFGR